MAQESPTGGDCQDRRIVRRKAMPDEDADVARLMKACEDLGEHFDNVQIFANRFDPEDGTISVNWGSGNWFARKGQVEGWIEKEQERARREVREE